MCDLNTTLKKSIIKCLALGLYLYISLMSTKLVADNKPAQRIIALSPHSVELLYAIGAGDKIVATLEYSDYPKAAKAIPRIGSFAGVQIEKLVEFQPDLVVGWKSGNKTSDLDKIKSLGFNLVYTQPSNINGIFSDLEKLGELTGRQKSAKSVIDNMKHRYQLIQQKYEKAQTINVFYQLWHDPLQSVGGDSWIESLIKDCGATNIFRDSHSPYPMISMESVIVKNPDVIIIPNHSGSSGEELGFWSKWTEIAAVKSNNIFTIDSDLLHRFSPRALDGLQILCEKIDKARQN